MVLFRRAEELSLSHALLDGCAEGNAGLLLVEGAVGCGKSEFLETVATRAEARGAAVLRAMGTAAERSHPLGVLRQLAADAPPGALSPPPSPAEAGRVEAMQVFAAAVRELSAAAPVVICVDDLHHVDELSSRYLLHLARGSRQARVLLVLTESVHERAEDPLLRTELLRLPHFVRLRLERFAPEAVRAMLPDRTEAETDRLYRTSGGNPLLLRSLLQDPHHRPGDAYTQAVLACLHRCGAATPRLAEAIAVLDDLAGAAHLARLTGAPEAAAVRALTALDAAGLIAPEGGHGFRHPAARAAVLDRMDPAARAALHREAALLARASGAPDTAVAAQLLAARHTAEEWALPVLRSAADQYVADGALAEATAVLQLAREACPDDAIRAELAIRLCAVAGRTDPAVAERHLLEPLSALAGGKLGPHTMGPLARVLAAQGRIDESADVLERLAACGGRHPGAERRHGDIPGDDPLDGLSAFPQWAASTRRGTPAETGPPPAGRTARTPVHPAALWALPVEAEEGAAAQAAELFLRGATLAEGTVEPVVQALRTLLYLDGAARALPWCESFVRQAAQRGATGWQAVFGGLLAEARMRLGDLTGAAGTAQEILRAVPAHGGSVLLCGIAGTLVRARTAMGRPEEAAAVLSRPAPAELSGSIHGLGYLRARGHYALATSRFHAALGDFLDIGRHMRRWGLDRPRLLPWRTDAAEALLKLGEAHQAERFLADQLTTRDAADPWVRGMTLRLRASLREPKERQAMLAKAVDDLHRSGDQYELARAMGDFGQVLREIGEPARAAMVNRRAWHVARECGAEALCVKILPGHTGDTADAAEPAEAPHADLVASLSESEKRVALLAVHGHTNREIAQKLYITVSTVEQHLTRVYRKLEIPGRQALPVDFHLGVAEFV
ncbi:helix-turn-helix transcriptional regulator [Streptomyces sp. NBC_00162]|uniref:helix-turn-helix transcriptional regulator n=1 Tax=Streptomyces sp. NBC_00162 TaxID=2903629 RepID=UPI00214B1585|nr:LuxR family transcriptional regulator [Streptomyces sp. NBC_00162]UUU39270.1 AAA family ATPase [Streptomyces sp. NBC_00162]